MNPNELTVPPLHDVDLKHLRLFKAVVECGGLSAAEELTGMGVSAISRQLSDLEVRLGAPLCRRGRSGFQLTTEGEATYQAALRLFDSVDEFRATVAAVKGEIGGEVGIWLIDHCISPANQHFSEALRRYSTDHPKVQLSLNVAGPQDVERAVAERKAALGITFCKSDLPGLRYHVVGAEDASLYCGRGHPAFGLDTTAARACLSASPSRVRRGYLADDHLAEQLPGPAGPVSYHIDATVLLLLTGLHVGIVPDLIAQPLIASGQLYRLPLPEFQTCRPLFLVTRAARGSSRAVDLMFDSLAAALAAGAGTP